MVTALPCPCLIVALGEGEKDHHPKKPFGGRLRGRKMDGSEAATRLWTRQGLSLRQALGAALTGFNTLLLLFAALSILGALFATWWHVLDLLAQFAIPALFAAGAVAIVETARRHWTRSALSLITGVVGVVTIWRSEPIAECAPGVSTHRIVFFNIWVGNAALAEALTYLEQSNADVIVLTELTTRSANYFAPLQKLYPHATACAKNGTCWTTAFSRVPFTDVSSVLDLPGRSPALAAMRISFPDGDVTVIGAHLTRPWPFDAITAQRRQVDALAKGLMSLPSPQLVVGDFNAVTWSSTVDALVSATGLKPFPSWGTWMAGLPTPLRLPLDQAFVGEGIACGSKTIGPELGSDHRPIIVDFALKPPK